MMSKENIISDCVFSKEVVFNGKKLAGVRSVKISYDVQEPQTLVSVTMVIKRNSLKITNRAISFDEAIYAPEESVEGN